MVFQSAALTQRIKFRSSFLDFIVEMSGNLKMLHHLFNVLNSTISAFYFYKYSILHTKGFIFHLCEENSDATLMSKNCRLINIDDLDEMQMITPLLIISYMSLSTFCKSDNSDASS